MVVHRSTLAVGLAAVAALALSGCSSSTKEATETSTSAAETTSAMTSAAPAAAAGLVGAGCAAYAEQVPTGPGSVEGLAKDPVAVAASNSPVLTTLAGALSGKLNPDVNLVETLNNGEFTVFAPTDEAFGKVDPATIDKLKTDSELLTSVLTYHVVSGQADPAAVVGEHKTVQGAPLTVTGSGDSLKVNDAGVVCGGIKTANATLYLIDTVLMPPAAPSPSPTPTPTPTP
ncbi:MAG: fasciclin domain-containing protein [Mycobacterium sp.]|nr:fasciclin domain-containing protein [Mycobacterium sp.]